MKLRATDVSTSISSGSGWDFERRIFGGVIVRLAEPLRLSNPESFIVSTH